MPEDIKSILKDIDEHGEGLTQWEINFVEEMMKKTAYSAKEHCKIVQIYEDRIPTEMQ